jgi:hypothetical protein
MDATYVRWTLQSTRGGQFLLFSSFLNQSAHRRKTLADDPLSWIAGGTGQRMV